MLRAREGVSRGVGDGRAPDRQGNAPSPELELVLRTSRAILASLSTPSARGFRTTSLPLPSLAGVPLSSCTGAPPSGDTAPASIVTSCTALVVLPLHLKQLCRILPQTHAAGRGIALRRSGAPGVRAEAEAAGEDEATKRGRQERTSKACGWGRGGGGGGAANGWRGCGGAGGGGGGRAGSLCVEERVGAEAGGGGGAVEDTSGGRAREKKPKPGTRKSRTGGGGGGGLAAGAAEVEATVEYGAEADELACGAAAAAAAAVADVGPLGGVRHEQGEADEATAAEARRKAAGAGRGMSQPGCALVE